MELHNMPTTGATECSVSLETMVWVKRNPGESDQEVFERAASIFIEKLKMRGVEFQIHDEENLSEWVTPPGDYD